MAKRAIAPRRQRLPGLRERTVPRRHRHGPEQLHQDHRHRRLLGTRQPGSGLDDERHHPRGRFGDRHCHQGHRLCRTVPLGTPPQPRQAADRGGRIRVPFVRRRSGGRHPPWVPRFAFADDVGRAFTTGFTDAMPVVGVALVVTPAVCPAFACDVPGARNRSLPKARTSSASPTHRVPDPDAGRSAHQTFDQRLPGVTGKIADPGAPRPAGYGRGDGRRPSLVAAVHSPEAAGLGSVLELVAVVARARARRPWAAQERLRAGAVPLARMTAGDEGPRLTDRTDVTALPPRER